MKKEVLKDYVLLHAHLVINDRKEYLDGMLKVRDGRIIDLQPQSGKFREEDNDLPVLDLRGRAVLPLNCNVLLPYSAALRQSEEERIKEGTGSYFLVLENDTRYSLARLREQKDLYRGCEGVFARVSKEEAAAYLDEVQITGLILLPEERDPELLASLRERGKKILFADSAKSFAKDETIDEDVVFAELLKTGEIGISERKILNLSLMQEENYKIFTPQKDNLHLLKIVTQHFRKDRLIFSLSALKAEEIIKALRQEKIPFRQIAAYLSCNSKRCFAGDELTLQKGRSADFYCLDTDGRILFAVKEGACYR